MRHTEQGMKICIFVINEFDYFVSIIILYLSYVNKFVNIFLKDWKSFQFLLCTSMNVLKRIFVGSHSLPYR